MFCLPVWFRVTDGRASESRVSVFSCCRQWTCDLELLERYRQALETAVNISVKHNLPPLPGRTLLVYLTDANANRLCPKSHLQGVKEKKYIFQGAGRMLGLERVLLPSGSLGTAQTEKNGVGLLLNAILEQF